MVDTLVEAEYEDGFVHTEDAQDRSLYDPERNVFYDIQNRLPEAEHGKTVRFSLYNLTDCFRQDVDCTMLPDDTMFIREKLMEIDFDTLTGETSDLRCIAVAFGYRYMNDEGVKEEIVEFK